MESTNCYNELFSNVNFDSEFLKVPPRLIKNYPVLRDSSNFVSERF